MKIRGKDCIDAIKATAKQGEITSEQAALLLSDIKRRAETAAQKRGISIDEAIKEIAGEIKLSEKWKQEVDIRNKLLTIKRLREAKAFIQKQRKWGDGLRKLMEETYDKSLYLDGVFKNKLQTGLEAAGVWNDFRKGLHSLDIAREMWELSFARPGGVTQNPAALKIAKVLYPLNSELVALTNRHGAYVRESPGHIGIQTHDNYTLRKMGTQGWGKASRGKSFKAWRAILDGLNIDWDRTLDEGVDREKFLSGFHQAIYNRVFGEPIDELEVEAFKPHGSLAHKLSAERVLWFADPESAWKYNQAMGVADYNEGFMQRIKSATHSAALMMHFGPNPEHSFARLRKDLERDADKLDDSAKQLDSLRSSKIDNEWFILSGKAQVSEIPWVSRMVDNVKQHALLSKGGGIGVTAGFVDPAFMNNAMVRHGFTAADRVATQLKAFTPSQLENIDFITSSYMQNIASRWVEGGREARWLKKAVYWQFQLTGLNTLTTIRKRAMADGLAHVLAKEAGLPFEKLSVERQQAWRDYDISPAEWDAWRGMTVKTQVGDGEFKVLSPEAIRTMDDATANRVLESKELGLTPVNRKRLRDEMESKFGAYFLDVVREALPEGGLRERALFAQGKKRGTFPREMLELASIFKMFPTAVMLRQYGHVRQSAQNSSGFLDWLLNGPKGRFLTVNLIVQAGIAGYLAMTAKDLLKGRTPKQLWNTEENKPNLEVWGAALARGGGAGIAGDLLLNEYNSHYRSFLGAALGPVLGQIDPIVGLASEAKGTAIGAPGAPSVESLGYRAERLVENNLPFASVFWLRPILDHMLFYHLQEGLSPGVLRRTERSVRDKNYQDFWIEPSETTD